MQAIGIHVDGAILRRAAVKLSGKKLAVESLQSVSRVKPLYNEAKTIPLVSGLSCRDLLINSSSIPASHKSRKIKEALKVQTQTQTHLQADSLVSVVLLEQKRKKATIYSTTHYALSTHLQELMAFDQDPDRVSAVPEALRSFVRWKAPDLLSYFLVDFGLATTHCLWVEEGLVQKAYMISFGVQDLDEPERARLFRSELSRTLRSFQCLRPMIVTGEDRDDYLAEPLQSCSSGEKAMGLSADEQRYAVPLGLAIDYLVNRKDPVQFRKQYSLSERNFFLIGRNALVLSILSICFCTALLVFGNRAINQREGELVQELNLKVAKDPELHRELRFSESNPYALIAQWTKMMKSYGKNYPYISKMPRAAEVLGWLSQQPFPLSFESVRYQLVSFPHLEALREPYLVKVEIEFKADPVHARQWHEMLMQGEGLCDASKEISWEQLTDGYSVSFFLKNRNSDV